MNIIGGTGIHQLFAAASHQAIAVVLVRHMDLLRLVPRQLDATPHLGRNVAAVPALSEQRVDGLILVPALFRSHLRQVSRRSL